MDPGLEWAEGAATAGDGPPAWEESGGPLHSRSSAAQPAPEALDSRNAAGSPAREAELASGTPQPRPRPEATHATERGSRELHLRTPGLTAPLAFRATSGCARFAVRQAAWAGTATQSLGRRRLH